MFINKAYLEKLRDPRWQKKRLEIMSRDDFACQYCGDETTTLNVHHKYYESGNDPWDYPPEALVTLCEVCHEGETENRKIDEKLLIEALRLKGMSHRAVRELTCELSVNDYDMKADEMISLLCWFIRPNRLEWLIVLQEACDARGDIAVARVLGLDLTHPVQQEPLVMDFLQAFRGDIVDSKK